MPLNDLMHFINYWEVFLLGMTPSINLSLPDQNCSLHIPTKEHNIGNTVLLTSSQAMCILLASSMIELSDLRNQNSVCNHSVYTTFTQWLHHPRFCTGVCTL